MEEYFPIPSNQKRESIDIAERVLFDETKRKKGRRFTENEDDTILYAGETAERTLIAPDWEYVADFHDRDAKQIYERYNRLMSEIPVSWTTKEIQILLGIEYHYGRDFVKLITYLPGKHWGHILQKLNESKRFVFENPRIVTNFINTNHMCYVPYLDCQLINALATKLQQ